MKQGLTSKNKNMLLIMQIKIDIWLALDIWKDKRITKFLQQRRNRGNERKIMAY